MTFRLDDDFIQQFIGAQPKWGPVGYVTYKRTYARGLDTILERHAKLAEHSGLVGTEEFWLTLVRVVEGTFNIQADHCLSLRLPWDPAIAQKKAQEMFRLMWEFKFLPPGRGLWTMGTPVIDKIGGAALMNCFGAETEIITSEGIKPIGELSGKTVRVLTRGGKWVDAPIRSFGKQRLKKMTLRRQGVDKVVYVTANHRWFATDRRRVNRDDGYVEMTTADLRPEIHRLKYVFGQGVRSSFNPSPFGIAHGFTFGDGHTVPGQRNANLVYLIGNKDSVLRPYFAMCAEQGRDDGVAFGSLPNFFREWPAITENKSYLLGWLMGYFAADGAVSNGQVTICSVKRENINFVRDVCSVIGIGYYSIREQTVISNLTHRDHTMYSLTLMRDTLSPDFFLIDNHRKNFVDADGDTAERRYWTVANIEDADRLETVYCATVPDEGSFALEGNILTGNCSFISTHGIASDFADPFCTLMDYSMLGVGVGFDTRGAELVEVREPTMSDEPHVVEDTREAWVELLRRVLNSFVGGTTMPEDIDYSKVRPAGSLIRGFGGTASGPEPLRDMVNSITDLLYSRTGQKLTSSDIVDLGNLIGRCVVAGNVRRSAEIAFGEPTDEAFLELKDEKNQAALDSHRWASNNSVFSTVGQSYSRVARQTAKNGEPGYLWLDNARNYGRMIDPPNDRDEKVMGANPCIAADTIITTADGPQLAGSLVGKPFLAIVGGVSYTCRTGFFYTGTKQLYTLRTAQGHELRATENHEILIPSGRWINTWAEVRDLRVGDSVVLDDLRSSAIITAIEPSGVEPVYDCTVEDIHAFTANGIVVHNCSEQSLHDYELCNLVETFPFNHANVREFKRTIKFAYLYAKTVTLLPTHNPKTNAVTMKNRRIGCSMSGIIQAKQKFGWRKFLDMCDETYEYIQELDKEYSDWLCIPRSIKTTSVKPSGTVSLLPQATPGIHHPYSEYYWRVIRFATDSKMLPALRSAGYKCIEIDPAREPNTTAVYFPVKEEGFQRSAREVSMWEQLEIAAALQAHWADNQVSATISFDKKLEGPQVARALELYETRLKGISFLPSSDHGYEHAPYQPITKEEYEAASAAIGTLDLSATSNETQDKFCDGGKCEIPVKV